MCAAIQKNFTCMFKKTLHEREMSLGILRCQKTKKIIVLTDSTINPIFKTFKNNTITYTTLYFFKKYTQHYVIFLPTQFSKPCQ